MRYKVRLADKTEGGKYKTITVDAHGWYVSRDTLVFTTNPDRPVRAFAAGEWLRVRQLDAS